MTIAVGIRSPTSYTMEIDGRKCQQDANILLTRQFMGSLQLIKTISTEGKFSHKMFQPLS